MLDPQEIIARLNPFGQRFRETFATCVAAARRFIELEPEIVRRINMPEPQHDSRIWPFEAIIGAAHVETADQKWSYEWAEAIFDVSAKQWIVKTGGMNSQTEEEEDAAKRAWNRWEQTPPSEAENYVTAPEDCGEGEEPNTTAMTRVAVYEGEVVQMSVSGDDEGGLLYHFAAPNRYESCCPLPEEPE